MLEARTRSKAATPSHVLLLKNLLSVVLGLVVLWSFVHSWYELGACLHALRVYSLVVVVLEGVCRYYPAAHAALPDSGAPAKARTKRQSKVGHVT